MDLFAILLLGMIQALTEWLPLSSKTMSALAYTMLGGKPEDILPMLIYLHAGTLLAAAIYFRKEILEMAKGLSFHSANRLLEGKAGFLASSIFFTGLVGVPILAAEKYFLPSLDGSALLSLMGAGLVFTGFLLTTQNKNRWRHEEAATWKDGVLTGALQGLSVLPGVSRAGTTTAALIWRGFDAKSAFRLSFLLSIPTVLLAELLIWISESGSWSMPASDGLALAASSFAFGYLTIDALIRIAQRMNVAWLAFLFGIMMLVFGLIGIG
ncbi:MAG: undecaprenyl-diphosphate phosphatase [Candidatus Micrarchaeota archaeon]|nr:undecaprenyl-diphosphate phosphatase [Candidatus Micrarchaeota archaeon]